jgi:hypothetical protein
LCYYTEERVEGDTKDENVNSVIGGEVEMERHAVSDNFKRFLKRIEEEEALTDIEQGEFKV